MSEPTERQRQIFEFIRQRVRERGYPPTVREIGEAVGLKSSSTVHAHLNRLEALGYIRRDPTKPRAIELLSDRPTPDGQIRYVPVVGRIAAGAPILAVEEASERFPLPSDWVGQEPVFLLRVEGESMIEAGILPGDHVIVRRQDTAENGDIVVALLDEEATVKRFYRESGQVRLQPENRAMEPIYARDVRIVGKVIGLIRRL